MNCLEARRRLETCVENRRPIDAAAGAHFHACPDDDCQRAWGDEQLLEEATRGWVGRAPQVDLSAAVIKELGSTTALPTARSDGRAAFSASSLQRTDRPAWGSLTAASLLLGLVCWGLSVRRDGPPASTASRWTAHPAVVEPSRRAPSSAQELSRTYLAVVESPPRLVADCVVAMVPGLRSRVAASDVPGTVPQPSLVPMSGSRAGVLWRSFEPVQREFDAALMYLEQAIPMGMGRST
jgi:hypothetical protein